MLKGSYNSSGGTIRLPKTVSSDIDTSDLSFSKYASTYFCGGATAEHVRKPLKQALLKHDLPIDDVASQALWIMIMRFMGDFPEAPESDPSDNNDTLGYANLMQTLSRLLAINAVRTAELNAAMGSATPHHFVRKTLKRKSKLPGVLRQVCDSNKDEVDYYQQVLRARTTHMDKLHFIIGHGILRPSLRDEILAQICKQLNKNPSRNSFSRGWLLLAFCVGCFSPTSTFENYFRSFIKHMPQQIETRLDRTLANGARTQPPSLLEVQALRGRLPLKLDISLMNGEVRKLQVDSASTAREIVQQLAQNLGLTDSFGFSVLITMHGKVMSLGSGNEHLLDAISSCEQFAKERGEREIAAPWQLCLRKEIFTPWYDPSVDASATHLVYKQVLRGLRSGEYLCRTEQDIAMLCALAYYIEHGSALNETQLSTFVKEQVPQDLLAPGESALQSWSKLIGQTFERSSYVKGAVPQQQRAKEDICLFAHLTWPMAFSRLFETVRIAGPQLQSDNLVLAVNATGLFFIDSTEQILAACSYAELMEVNHKVCQELCAIDELNVYTAQQENFTFKCYEAGDAAELINYIWNGLRRRSKYAVAMAEQSSIESESQLQLKCGDLVEFENDVLGEQVLDKNTVQRWWRGSVNKQSGEFMANHVHVLATLAKPSEKLLEIYKDSKQSTPKQRINSLRSKRAHSHNLAYLAELQFREPNEHDEVPMWSYSPRPLKMPLLKLVCAKPDLHQSALVIYHHILKYMGDIPRGNLAVNTDLIFQPTLQEELLCDEFYCQLMKQLTNNRVIASEERGWELLYLATGLIAPGALVMRELSLFLRASSHVLADPCLKRLSRTLVNGKRKHAPHDIEVEGIQQRCMHIYHKIYFPDNTVEAFEIESYTRGLHLIEQIALRLNMNSYLGFSLFLKVGEKVYAMPEGEFVFDFISDLMQWLRQQKPLRNNYDGHYQLHFMRKLWLNNKPGTDINTDVIFNYPQELHKYLKGCYAVDCELASQLAALIYVADNGSSLAGFQRLQELLITLLPEDVISLQTVPEWRHQILTAVRGLSFDKSNSLASDVQAKEMFLLKLSAQSCFGSTFFTVKQLNDGTLLENILIAINLTGFHIIDPHTKSMLRSFQYSELGIWSSGKNHFHIRFGNMIGASKLLCNTSQGYKMDDLLSSYMLYFNKN